MRLVAVVASCLVSLLLPTGAGAVESAPPRVSGPVLHDNLAIYFLHGPSRPGAVPLTLDEALAKGLVQVRETGQVNSLEVENLGDRAVFIQSGDIVKGGKQDRTLTVSLLLPPKSGRVPIASFCVERGRWSPRAREDARHFRSASAIVPSRELKLAMQAPLPAVGPAPAPANETGARQAQVWDSVRAAQDRLSKGAGANVRPAHSESSLQLALENEKLAGARDAYVKALKDAPGANDIVGFMFAVNGKLNSGDVYASNTLFRKMWPKLIAASAVEAVGRRNEAAAEPPSANKVSDFLAATGNGKLSERPLNFGMRRVLHEADDGYLIEAALDDGFVHRSYLAR
jgi:hypothetical protein